MDTEHDEPIRQLGGSRRDARTTLAVGLPLVALVLVVGAGLFGSSPEPSPSPAPRVAFVASRPPVAPTSPPVPTPTASPAATPRPAAACKPKPIDFDATAVDLNGPWAADDGGIYYVRQLGAVVWWSGMSGRDGPVGELGRDWNNVGRGEIQDDLTIVAEWVDVPRGWIQGDGTADFQIGPDSEGNIQLTKTSETGSGRGDTVWAPCLLRPG